MHRIENYITQKNNSGEKVLSVFLTSGFPDPDNFVELALNILDAGADILEIGFPFSDPIADGLIIQYSSKIALDNGINLEQTFRYAKEIRKETEKPIILMGYANPALRYGLHKFSKQCIDSGIDGLIIPDVPIEEFDVFYNSDFDFIDKIQLVTPTTPPDRVLQIDQISSGFIYCVSVSGTTGLPNENRNIQFIKNSYSILKKNKMLIGFGISNEEDAKFYAPFCDGIIVGSAIIKLLTETNGNYNDVISLVKKIKVCINPGLTKNEFDY